MTYQETRAKLDAMRASISAIRQDMRALQAAIEPQPVADCVLDGWEGPVRLAALFGDKDTLFAIHNMGRRCDYCSLWADSFNGVHRQIATRAAFVVISPDAPAAQKRLAAERGWTFPMASYGTSGFGEAMGYARDGGWYPGVSVLRKRPEGIVRVSDAAFGPGDDFAGIWHLFDLIPEGAAGWEPIPSRRERAEPVAASG